MPEEDKKTKDKTSEGEKDTNNDNDGESGKEGETGKDDVVTPEVKKLRKENAKKRVENKELRDKLAEAEASKSTAKSDDDAKDVKKKVETTDVLKIVNQRYMRSELKAAALSAGLKDTDALKMFDTSSLEISDSGDVIGIKDLIDEMVETKGYLFDQESKNTTSDKKTPGAAAPSSKSALDMSDEEYAVEAKKLGINTDNQY